MVPTARKPFERNQHHTFSLRRPYYCIKEIAAVFVFILMINLLKYVLFVIVILAVVIPIGAQTRKRTPAKKTPAKTASSKPVPTPTPSPIESVPVKKNGWPEPQQKPGAGKANKRHDGASKSINDPAFTPAYFYEFTQPDFVVSQILIEHDEKGKGKISFMKRGFEELITDPIQLSSATLTRIDEALATLNFLDSSEDYQYEKDYSHLGNIKIRVAKGGRDRTTKFNWTENKDAKLLADEYRKIGNQFVWMFDIEVARENQPLEAPRLLDSLDSMIRRKEVSDPNQMVPFLQVLSNDERVPLIARNHAGKLVKQIEKEKK